MILKIKVVSQNNNGIPNKWKQYKDSRPEI